VPDGRLARTDEQSPAALQQTGRIIAGFDIARPGGPGLFVPHARIPDSALVECRELSFGYGERRILDGVSFSVPRGKVTALMGASGGGKTTVLRLIGGQVRPQHGSLTFDGQEVAHARRRRPVRACAGAWACCSSSARCSRTCRCSTTWPSRCASTRGLPENLVRDIVLMKLNAVGLRGARDLMPSEVSGGMARRVALARAIALDPDWSCTTSRSPASTRFRWAPRRS
jgi:phospholipid/cholesterol/gamma-HCH transport system ATP-binding protein